MASWRALRLACIECDPECFCTTLDEARAQTITYYQQHLLQAKHSPLFLFGAFDTQQQLIGTLALEQLSGKMRRHRGRLWGLMVRPDARGHGVARKLCLTAIAQSQNLPVTTLQLELTHCASAARTLYEDLGFKVCTTYSQAFFLNGQYLDEIIMVKAL